MSTMSLTLKDEKGGISTFDIIVLKLKKRKKSLCFEISYSKHLSAFIEISRVRNRALSQGLRRGDIIVSIGQRNFIGESIEIVQVKLDEFDTYIPLCLCRIINLSNALNFNVLRKELSQYTVVGQKLLYKSSPCQSPFSSKQQGLFPLIRPKCYRQKQKFNSTTSGLDSGVSETDDTGRGALSSLQSIQQFSNKDSGYYDTDNPSRRLRLSTKSESETTIAGSCSYGFYSCSATDFLEDITRHDEQLSGTKLKRWISCTDFLPGLLEGRFLHKYARQKFMNSTLTLTDGCYYRTNVLKPTSAEKKYSKKYVLSKVEIDLDSQGDNKIPLFSDDGTQYQSGLHKTGTNGFDNRFLSQRKSDILTRHPRFFSNICDEITLNENVVRPNFFGQKNSYGDGETTVNQKHLQSNSKFKSSNYKSSLNGVQGSLTDVLNTPQYFIPEKIIEMINYTDASRYSAPVRASDYKIFGCITLKEVFPHRAAKSKSTLEIREEIRPETHLIDLPDIYTFEKGESIPWRKQMLDFNKDKLPSSYGRPVSVLDKPLHTTEGMQSGLRTEALHVDEILDSRQLPELIPTEKYLSSSYKSKSWRNDDICTTTSIYDTELIHAEKSVSPVYSVERKRPDEKRTSEYEKKPVCAEKSYSSVYHGEKIHVSDDYMFDYESKSRSVAESYFSSDTKPLYIEEICTSKSDERRLHRVEGYPLEYMPKPLHIDDQYPSVYQPKAPRTDGETFFASRARPLHIYERTSRAEEIYSPDYVQSMATSTTHEDIRDIHTMHEHKRFLDQAPLVDIPQLAQSDVVTSFTQIHLPQENGAALRHEKGRDRDISLISWDEIETQAADTDKVNLSVADIISKPESVEIGGDKIEKLEDFTPTYKKEEFHVESRIGKTLQADYTKQDYTKIPLRVYDSNLAKFLKEDDKKRILEECIPMNYLQIGPTKECNAIKFMRLANGELFVLNVDKRSLHFDLHTGDYVFAINDHLIGQESLKSLIHFIESIPYEKLKFDVRCNTSHLGRSMTLRGLFGHLPFGHGSHNFGSGFSGLVGIAGMGVPLRPGKNSSILVQINEAREREKRELSHLNDKFAQYVEKVRFLEAQNRKLQLELEALQNKAGQGSSRIKEMYEVEMQEARKLIDDTSKDKAAAEVKAREAEGEANNFKKRYQDILVNRNTDRQQLDLLQQEIAENEAKINLLRRRLNDLEDEARRYKAETQRLLSEISRLNNELQNEAFAKSSLETEKMALEDELHMLKQMHEAELNELRSKTVIDVGLDPSQFFRNELANAIREIRSEYEAANEQQRNDLHNRYMMHYNELVMRHQKPELDPIQYEQQRVQEEKLRITLTSTKNEAAHMKARNEELAQRIREIQSLLEAEKEDGGRLIAARDQELEELRNRLEQLLKEYDEVSSMKTSLEKEISQYRELLEGTTSHDGLRQVVEHIEEEARRLEAERASGASGMGAGISALSRIAGSLGSGGASSSFVTRSVTYTSGGSPFVPPKPSSTASSSSYSRSYVSRDFS